MAEQLERALLVAEITELQKQQSEAHIRDIYVGLTLDGQAAWQKRDARSPSYGFNWPRSTQAGGLSAGHLRQRHRVVGSSGYVQRRIGTDA